MLRRCGKRSECRPEDSADGLLDRADQALYLAKQWGKNQAVGEHRLEGRSALGALAHLLT